MTKSHSKDLIDTFDQNPCQERRQGFISDGASTVPDIGRWRGVEREVAASAAEAWRNIIQLKATVVELRRRLERWRRLGWQRDGIVKLGQGWHLEATSINKTPIEFIQGP